MLVVCAWLWITCTGVRFPSNTPIKNAKGGLQKKPCKLLSVKLFFENLVVNIATICDKNAEIRSRNTPNYGKLSHGVMANMPDSESVDCRFDSCWDNKKWFCGVIENTSGCWVGYTGLNPVRTTNCPLAEWLLHRSLKPTLIWVCRFESYRDNKCHLKKCTDIQKVLWFIVFIITFAKIVPWCNWLTRQILILKTQSSSLWGTTK